MAIIKAISSHAPIKTVLDYVIKNEKVQNRLISGVGCSVETAKEEMEATKELYGKTGGRTYKHFVQSFAPGEDITPQKAHDIALQLVKDMKLFNGYEVLIATHEDKSHVHSHFVVNSVNYENGCKFQMSNKDLQDLKDRSDELCRENGLSICEKGKAFDGSARQNVVAWIKEKYQYLVSAVAEGNTKSYMCNIKDAVQNSMEKAESFEEFKKLLDEQGVAVVWKESRKHVTYIDAQAKKVRDSNLQKTFNLCADKDSLLKQFEENRERREVNKTLVQQKDTIVSKYKVSFYSDVVNTLSRQVKGQKNMLDNIVAKWDLSQGSISRLQTDIEKWAVQKKECPSYQIKKRYELVEKIEHGKVLIESIQADVDNCIFQYGFSSMEDVQKSISDLKEAENLLEKIEDKRLLEEKNLQDLESRNVQIQISNEAVNMAKDELQVTFAEDFSDKKFKTILNEEAISLDEERNRIEYRY